jgi:hypothetical protein
MHNLIIKYINNLSIDDINTFAIKEGIKLTKTELNYLYIFIKNDYNLFLNNPNNFNIDDYKDRFSEENYPKIKEVFLKYFNKFKNYL